MAALDKYRKTLSLLLPAGLIGASFLLSTTALAALPPRAGAEGVNSNSSSVAQRLAVIRDAVSSVAGAGAGATHSDLERLAWWGNGGWRNGGWRNGGWGNFLIPFVAPWGNGWNNWGNGFRNNWGNGGWGNGGWHNWHNY
jgi:hypothetical protein